MVLAMTDAQPPFSQPLSSKADLPHSESKAHRPAPRWFKVVSGWGLALLKPILPARWLSWLEHAAWFLTIGTFNTALAYVLFVGFLNLAGLSRGWALFVAYFIGMFVAYQSFSRLVFAGGRQLAWVRFGPAYIVLYLANKGLLELMVWGSGFSEELSQFLLLPVVAGLSYLINRFFVFRGR